MRLVGKSSSSLLAATRACFSKRIKEIIIHVNFAIAGLGIATVTSGNGLATFAEVGGILFPAWFFITAFVYFLNDVFDRKADKINERDLPLATGEAKLKQVMSISLASLFTALFLSYLVNEIVFLLCMAFAGLGVIYSIPPIRIKKKVWGKPFTIISSEIITLLAGGFSLGIISSELGFMCLTVVVLVPFIYPTVDLRDMKGDKKQEVSTIPTIIGTKRTIDMAIFGFSLWPVLFGVGNLYFGLNLPSVLLFALVCSVNVAWLLKLRSGLQKGMEPHSFGLQNDYKKTSLRTMLSVVAYPSIFLAALA